MRECVCICVYVFVCVVMRACLPRMFLTVHSLFVGRRCLPTRECVGKGEVLNQAANSAAAARQAWHTGLEILWCV
jgi:hypothetical protein